MYGNSLTGKPVTNKDEERGETTPPTQAGRTRPKTLEELVEDAVSKSAQRKPKG